MYDTEEHFAECAAYEQRYQQALDLLYYMGCQYSIKDKDMRLLCDHMGVHWDDLQRHGTSNSTNSTKANICQSQLSFSVTQEQANQPAFATLTQQKPF